jgi:hypothetical protein
MEHRATNGMLSLIHYDGAVPTGPVAGFFDPDGGVAPAALPFGGTTYDGTGYINSGLDVIRLPGDPPFTLTFTILGIYEYQYIPHGVVMKATVVVQEAGAARPENQAAADARVEQERAALTDEGEAEIADGYVNSGFLGELNGEPLPGGPTYELTFATPGEHPCDCILHASGPEGLGMAGTIRVT